MKLRMFHLGENLGSKDKDPQAAGYTYCCLTLWQWAFIQTMLSVVLLVVVIALFLCQTIGVEATKLYTTRMGTPITQTLGIWVNATTMKKHVFDDLVFGDNAVLAPTCSTYGYSSSSIANMFIRPVVLSVNTINSSALVLIYYIISFVCQSLSLLTIKDNAYYKKFNEGKNNLAGNIEQSLAAPFMLVTLCLQIGITDVCTLINVAANIFAFSMFQMLAETLFEDKSDYGSVELWLAGSFFFYAIAHVSGWLTLVCALAPLIINMSSARTCLPTSDAFTILTTAMVLIEIGCLIASHLIQLVSMKLKSRPSNVPIGDPRSTDQRIKPTYDIEFASILVGMISKLTFLTLIYAANLA